MVPSIHTSRTPRYALLAPKISHFSGFSKTSRSALARFQLRAAAATGEEGESEGGRELAPVDAALLMKALQDEQALLAHARSNRTEFIKIIREIRSEEEVPSRDKSGDPVSLESLKQGYLDVIKSEITSFDASDLSLLFMILFENDMSSTGMRQLIINRLRALCLRYVELGDDERLEKSSMFDARSLATLVHTLSKCNGFTSNVAKMLEPVLLDIRDYNPIQVGLILHVYSRNKIRSSSVFNHLIDRLLACNKESFDAQAVSNIVNSLANLNLKDQRLLTLLIEVSISFPTTNMTSQSISTIASSYAKLGLIDRSHFEHLASCVMSISSSSFSLKELMECTSSFLRCESLAPAVFRYLLLAIENHEMSEMSARSLSTHCRSMVKLKHLGGNKIIKKMKAAVVNSSLDPYSLSSFAISFLQAGVLDTELWRHMEQDFIRHLDDAISTNKPPRGRETSSTFSALAKSGQCSLEAVKKLETCMRAFAFSWVSSQDLASIMSAIARLTAKVEDGFQSDLHRHLLALCDSGKLSPDEAIIIGGAIAKLRMIEKESVEKLSKIIHGSDRSRLQVVQILSLNTMINGLKSHPDSSSVASSVHRIEDVVMSWVEKGKMKDVSLELGCKLLASFAHGQEVGGGADEEEDKLRRIRAVTDLLLARITTLLNEWWEDGEEGGKRTSLQGGGGGAVSKRDMAGTIVLVSQALARANVRDENIWRLTVKLYRNLPAEQKHPTSLASVLESMARVDLKDERFLLEASKTFQSEIVGRNILSDLNRSKRSLWDADSKTISSLITSFIRLQFFDQNLFQHISKVVQQLDLDELSPQEVSMLLNAFLRVDMLSNDILQFLSSAVQSQQAAGSYSIQCVSSLFRDFSRAGLEDMELYQHLKRLLLLLNPRELNEFHAASISSAMVQLRWRDEEIWGHMSAALRKRPERQIDPQAAASLLRAQAFLYIEDAALLDRNLGRVISQDHSIFSSQYVALFAWSVAVLSPFLPPNSSSIIKWILHAVIARRTKLDAPAKAQIHQFLIINPVDEQEGFDKKLIDQLKEDCFKSFKESSEEVSLSSTQQANMSSVLRSMGYQVLDERVDNKTGYSLDCWIPQANIIVEFDGPSHFCQGSQLPLGSTRIKRRALRSAGYRLVSINYWDWQQDASMEYKQELLARSLEQADVEVEE